MRIYVRDGLYKCPRCKSKNMTGGPIKIEGSYITQDRTCNDCGLEWGVLFEFRNSFVTVDTNPQYLPSEVQTSFNNIESNMGPYAAFGFLESIEGLTEEDDK